MSWLFSQALAEAHLEPDFSGGEPYARLSVMPTAQPFWHNGKPMEPSQFSQSGLTSRVLTEADGEALLTSFLAASRVRISAQRVRELESRAKLAGYGWKWPGSFAKYDRDSRSWRTRQCSLLGGWAEFSVTWPRWGSMRNGECLEQPTAVSTTDETGSGSLPTPSGVNGGKNNTMGRVDEWGGSSNPLRGTVIGSLCSPEFEELVMGWPVTWTALTPLETARFQPWLRMHSDFSQFARDADNGEGSL